MKYGIRILLITLLSVLCALSFSACNVEETPEPDVPASHEHVFGEWIDGSSPNCETGGTLGHYTCSICKLHFNKDGVQLPSITVEKLGHDIAIYEEKAPTCTEDGHGKYMACSRCDFSTYVKITAGHKLGEWELDTPATCAIDGIEKRSCIVCDYYETRNIQKLQHNIISHEAKEPSCTEIGWAAYESCSLCDYTTYVELTKSHTLSDWHSSTASCTEAGFEKRECEICDYEETRETEAKGHAFGELIPTKEASCTENGCVAHYICSACKKIFDENKNEILSAVIPASHKLINHPAKLPTCTEKGWDAYVSCSKCGYNTYEEISVRHALLEWETVTSATCTLYGTEKRNCSLCSYFETRQTNKLPHDTVPHASKAPTCTERGWAAYESCKNCSYTTYKEIPPSHTLGAWQGSTASCDTKGYEFRKCLYCDYTEERETEALSHSLGAWVGNASIGYYTCTRCNEKFDKQYEKLSFPLNNVTLNGSSIEGYIITSDGSAVASELSKKLQRIIFEKSGIYIEVSNSVSQAKKISIQLTAKDMAGETGFRARVSESNLYIECAYSDSFSSAFDEYCKDIFGRTSGIAELGNYTSPKNYAAVTYAEFGAVGDGKTNDYEAILATHNYANAQGKKVLGEAGKTYYIANVHTTIKIMTDVDWCGAEFIIDGSNSTVDNARNIFNVAPDSYNTTASKAQLDAINAKRDENGAVIRGISHGDSQTAKLDLGLGYPAMLIVYNKTANIYIRWGYADSKGSQQQEVIVIDKNGNIDPSTPFMHDFDNVSSITVHRIDTKPISLKNARFTSISSQVNLISGSKYLSQGIIISRPNTTVDNVVHVIEGEIAKNAPTRQIPGTTLWEDVSDEGFTVSAGAVYLNGTKYTGNDVKAFVGHAYNGFINVYQTHNALIKNCVFQGRVYYTQGTYDISCTLANKIEFRNCNQSNFFEKDASGKDTKIANMSLCWGVSGTNYCKNMYYVNSSLTRYDAHCGVLNGGVIGGRLSVLRLIGGGTFTIDGVEFYARSVPIQLREDYGASFNGTLVVKDTYFRYCWGSGTNANYSLTLIDAPTANVYNGYEAYFPNIIIDNISVETNKTAVQIVAVGGQTYSQKEHYPARSIIKEPVNDPTALFTVYYETADPNVVTKKPELFPYLQNRTKTTKDPSQLNDNEYTVVNNGNGTYTVIAHNAPNLQPYHAPAFIEIRNMKNFKNANWENITLKLYKSDFFSDTEIIDEDGVLVWDTTYNK